VNGYRRNTHLLPGSKKEVDEIEQILKSHQLKVVSYTGKRGTEESFLTINGKAPQILHVATHGFFYTPDEAQEIDYLRGYEDAMSLSGLIMSGGNAAWRGRELPPGVLGGILTASNIARLDLNKNELTVLSACQSGRGQATPEGLYGLQRAFKKAGVKTMIMSLWYVSDVIGTEFMNLFYENLFDKDNHYNKRQAFDKAKSAIREKYSEPFYWACFVMVD
jgi:CHAT domain-containing protein